ncbi:MAG: hypothetical protein JJE45_00215 [Prolixibacteraceae bacterium]|nr:hypothetical protein [Prolixibacteraceae bacterium]
MGIRRREVRLGGKDLFIYYHKKIGIGNNSIIPKGCTNKRVLSKRTGIDYNTLMWNFTRQGKSYYENDDTLILKVYPGDIEKGGQSMIRRGKGGMENFAKYIGKRTDY